MRQDKVSKYRKILYKRATRTDVSGMHAPDQDGDRKQVRAYVAAAPALLLEQAQVVVDGAVVRVDAVHQPAEEKK
jgi:hypothetical protein